MKVKVILAIACVVALFAGGFVGIWSWQAHVNTERNAATNRALSPNTDLDHAFDAQWKAHKAEQEKSQQ
jgi:flagellar basal body-associated protein FliL